MSGPRLRPQSGRTGTGKCHVRELANLVPDPFTEAKVHGDVGVSRIGTHPNCVNRSGDEMVCR